METSGDPSENRLQVQGNSPLIMVDGIAISSREEVEGRNGTAEETVDGWMEAMAASFWLLLRT